MLTNLNRFIENINKDSNWNLSDENYNMWNEKYTGGFKNRLDIVEEYIREHEHIATKKSKMKHRKRKKRIKKM